MKTGKLSTSKVSATLRRAGFRTAKWIPSGQIRGWGSWSNGFKLKQQIDESIRCTIHAGKAAVQLELYSAALSKWYNIKIEDHAIIITSFKPQP
jgi:hypothetical protein